jgi:hypothetical protein
VPFPIFFENGRVGIGEQTPEVELDVVGDAAVTGNLEVGGALTVDGLPVAGLGLGPVGSAPNANGASLTDGELVLQPASASFPGVVTAGAQTLAGAKTLANDATLTTGVVNSSVANGASAVGFELDTTNSFSTAGAKLVSFRNANTEKAYVDKDGRFAADGSAGGFVQTGTTAQGLIFSGSNTVVTGAIVYINTPAGVNLAQCNTSGVEVPTVGQGFILKSPDGTRYKITVANGGALSTTPA